MKIWTKQPVKKDNKEFEAALAHLVSETMMDMKDAILDEMFPGMSKQRPLLEDGKRDPNWDPTFKIIAYEDRGECDMMDPSMRHTPRSHRMSQEVGIKETKEIAIAAFKVATVIVLALKDGFQLGKDVEAIMSGLIEDPECVAALKAAYEDAAKASAEVGDVGLFEGLELAKLFLAEGKALAAKLQKV